MPLQKRLGDGDRIGLVEELGLVNWMKIAAEALADGAHLRRGQVVVASVEVPLEPIVFSWLDRYRPGRRWRLGGGRVDEVIPAKHKPEHVEIQETRFATEAGASRSTG